MEDLVFYQIIIGKNGKLKNYKILKNLINS
jgi:hypothetical protein